MPSGEIWEYAVKSLSNIKLSSSSSQRGGIIKRLIKNSSSPEAPKVGAVPECRLQEITVGFNVQTWCLGLLNKNWNCPETYVMNY